MGRYGNPDRLSSAMIWRGGRERGEGGREGGREGVPVHAQATTGLPAHFCQHGHSCNRERKGESEKHRETEGEREKKGERD